MVARQRSGLTSTKREAVDHSGGAIPEEMRVIRRGHAQHVDAHAVARPGVPDAVPAVALVGQQVGDVALMPDVA